jgi:hypothetical protein
MFDGISKGYPIKTHTTSTARDRITPSYIAGLDRNIRSRAADDHTVEGSSSNFLFISLIALALKPSNFLFDVKLHGLLSRHAMKATSLPPEIRRDAETSPRAQVGKGPIAKVTPLAL